MNRGEVLFYNASESKLREVNETMLAFFAGLPQNESDRMAVTADAASESCGLPRINATMFRSSSMVHERGQQLHHVAEIMEGSFNSRLNPTRIERVAQSASKVGQYSTIVGSYNAYVDAACAFDREQPETVEDYYLASATLGFELLMVQYGMYYKTAFKLNRALSHHRVYRVVQSAFGDKALGAMMSGSYWMVHGTLSSAPDFVRTELDAANLTLSADATRATQTKQIERFVGSEVIPRNLSAAANRCYDNIRAGGSSDGPFGGIGSGIQDALSDVFGDGHTAADVLDSLEGVDAADLSDEQVSAVKQCLSDETDR